MLFFVRSLFSFFIILCVLSASRYASLARPRENENLEGEREREVRKKDCEFHFHFLHHLVSCSIVWSRFSQICVFLFYHPVWASEQWQQHKNIVESWILYVVVCLINPSDWRATSLISSSRAYWFRIFNWKGQWISSALINDLFNLSLCFHLYF